MRRIIIFLLLACAVSANAKVKLQPMFSSNMVLQQQSVAPIWGEAAPKKTLKLTTSWDNKTYKTQTDAEGNWRIDVETPKAGGPYTITINDGKKLVLDNVLIGEVWLCTGQSNMEMPLAGWGKINNYQQEIAEAENHPNIRLLTIVHTVSPTPQKTIEAVHDGWDVCSSATIPEFSSAAYFFARQLQKVLNVPVGLISTNWGGTIAEAWTSRESLEKMPYFKAKMDQLGLADFSEEEGRARFEKRIMEWSNTTMATEGSLKDGEVVWAGLGYDETDAWKTVQQPGEIDQQGFGNFNGVIWYRKTFDIPSSWAGKELSFELGNVDDDDFTYFNGQLLGHTEGYGKNRVYKVPANLVKAGKAVVAIRSVDTGGGAGLMGSGDDIVLKKGKDQISLKGAWKANATLSLTQVPAMPQGVFGNPNVETVLYNAMIHPLVPYAIKGAIWYQGEANAERAFQYERLLPLMITDWRQKWGQDFPFYLAQLANFMQRKPQPSESEWAELREAQAHTLRLPGTGMAVLIDIGDANDIHPKNKQEVGRRLALNALAMTYGQKVAYSGPIYKDFKVEGKKVRLSFDHTDGGLSTPQGAPLKGFAMAGPDQVFHWAKATIQGNTVVVECDEVELPMAVRYAWADNPECNLYNGAGLPASPFRTDNWPGLTSHVK